jgi:TonB-dependent receptor
MLASATAPAVFAQKTSNISGTVKDALNGEALPGANVVLVGTGMGATSDVQGRFVVRNVPAGAYTLRVTYLGYDPAHASLTLEPGVDIRRDFKLTAVAIEGETVVVTAQAAGQDEAINRQLSSMPVMSVVSAARIQELPDANAAESVGRLPGVSLVRTGGEGSQVVVRGLAPQYNQVTIDGVEMPSDVASANNLTTTDKTQQESQANILGDRGADLSMISSGMLGGIEVIKAITPDMDATLIGGVVNFGLRKAAMAPPGAEGVAASGDASWWPRTELRGTAGYNNLKDTYNDYRLAGSLEQRFFDQAFGVFLQATGERRNLSSNNLGVGYVLNDKDHGDAGIPDLNSITLTDVHRIRERVGGTLVLDYQHAGGEIGLMNFLSSSETNAENRGELIYPNRDLVYYQAGETNNRLKVISNLLSVKQDIPLFRVDLRLSHSYSETHNPEDLTFQFTQFGAGYANMANITKQPPDVIWSFLQPNDSIASLAEMSTTEILSQERTLTGNLDFQTDVVLTQDLTAKIKFGGMWQHRSREYNYDVYSGTGWHDDGLLNNLLQVYPDLIISQGDVGFRNFVYDGYKYGEFLNGQYSLPYAINIGKMWEYLPIVKGTSQLGDRGGYQLNELGTTVNDYDGTEDKGAGYIMGTFTIGEQVSILPGVRYQNLTTEYTATRGMIVPGGRLQGKDTTVIQSHGYWLPMAHVRYRPFEWLQLHFAYTNTINYPDYSTITPRYVIGTGYISYNNYRINPARSENLDLVASFHSNDIGLFTLNGFRKRIKDLVFFSKQYLTNLSEYPDLPQGGTQLYEFNTYINNPYDADVYGIETEWQTHFWYLPQPFSGLVLNVNYTHIYSNAKYPREVLETIYNEDGSFTQTRKKAPYEARLLNQPNDILNLILGYDLEGFSARLSMLYQDNIFKLPDFWMQQRVYSAKYIRWDLSLKQELPWWGMQILFNIANVTGEDELDVNQKTSYPANEQRYGMTADLGIRLLF